MIDLKELEERVILAAVSTSETDMAERSLDELKELADTAGAKTVGRVIQNREAFIREPIWEKENCRNCGRCFTKQGLQA